MVADVADGHAAGIEAQNLVVKTGESGDALGQDLRLEAALTVPWRVDLHRPQIGLHPLGGVAVADVGALRHAARRVAEVVGHLGLQRRLNNPASQLREQPTGP